MSAIVEHDSVEMIERAKIDFVVERPPAQAPQILEQKRRRDDRWTGIKGEAVLPVHTGAAAGLIQSLQHGHTIAPRAKPHGGRKTAKPAADDDCVPGRSRA
jgi:hypothetical protein